MSRERLIRLNNVTSSAWRFELVNLGEREAFKLTQKLVADLNQNLAGLSSAATQGWGGSQWSVVETAGRRAFHVYPIKIFGDQRLKAALDAGLLVALADQIREVLIPYAEQVQMLKVLDALIIHDLHLSSHASGFCTHFYNYGKRGLEEHVAAVREIWRRYLGHLLAEEVAHGGLLAPDLFEEILLEYPILDLEIVTRLFATHYASGRSYGRYLAFHNEYTVRQREAALTRLVEQGILGHAHFVENSSAMLNFEIGEVGQLIYPHHLPAT
jgi:hypothetical protein